MQGTISLLVAILGFFIFVKGDVLRDESRSPYICLSWLWTNWIWWEPEGGFFCAQVFGLTRIVLWIWLRGRSGNLENGSIFSRISVLGRVLIWRSNILLTDGRVPLAYNIVLYRKRLSSSVYLIPFGPLCLWRFIRLTWILTTFLLSSDGIYFYQEPRVAGRAYPPSGRFIRQPSADD